MVIRRDLIKKSQTVATSQCIAAAGVYNARSLIAVMAPLTLLFLDFSGSSPKLTSESTIFGLRRPPISLLDERVQNP
jgi:hypothetical protein